MLPSEFLNLDPTAKREIRNGIRAQGSGVGSPLQLIEQLMKLRKTVNSTYLANIVDYWIDDTKYPKLHITSEITSQDGDGKWVQEIIFVSPPIQATGGPGMLGLPVKDKTGKVIPGEVWWMYPMPVTTPVKVRCSCPDFQHTFSWEDFDIKSLKGRRIQYLRSAGSTRPPRNPDHFAGVCKHLGSLLYVLQRSTNVLEKTPQLRSGSMFM